MKLPAAIPCLPVSRSTDLHSDPDEIDYTPRDRFGEIMEPCMLSPVGQCQYDHHDGYEKCIHCGKGDGVL
jgi:hypothetical protein